MTLWIQLSIIAVFFGLTVFFGGGWPKRVVMFMNAVAGGVILFFIAKLAGDIITRINDLVRAAIAASFPINPILFVFLTLLGLFGIPLILIFVIKERRRSVVLAIAFALFNLVFTLNIGGEAASGFYNAGAWSGIAFALLFLLEGAAMGALMMKGKPELPYIIALGFTAALPALVGFNFSFTANLELINSFAQTTALGFFVFYLPFILAAPREKMDVIWQFVGLSTGLVLTSVIVTAIPLLGG